MKIYNLKQYTGTCFVFITGIILVFSSWLHQIEINEWDYATCPLIEVEITIMICLYLFVLFQPILAIFYAFKKQWRLLGIITINTVLAILFIAVAMILDAPTLSYMT